MLANTQEIESDAVPDQPPANWYTDPTDESQYRYWDGSAWTEYRAPRYAEDSPKPLRGPNRLIVDSLRILRRQWRGCTVAALVSIITGLVLAALFVYSADLVLMGELDEILDRITQPEFDPTTSENEAYFESLDFDFSVLNFVPAVIGLLLAWAGGAVPLAIVSRLTLRDLRSSAFTLSEVWAQAWRRIPRILGVELQLMVLAAVPIGLIVLIGVTAPLLLILAIPAFLFAIFMASAIIALAYVVASVGPARSSFKYALELVRGRFWGVLGRILLIDLIVIVVSVVSSFVMSLTGSSWLLEQAITGAVGTVLSLPVLIAAAILYVDLGGESD